MAVNRICERHADRRLGTEHFLANVNEAGVFTLT